MRLRFILNFLRSFSNNAGITKDVGVRLKATPRTYHKFFKTLSLRFLVLNAYQCSFLYGSKLGRQRKVVQS